MVAGVPFMCMRTTAAPERATTSAMAGSERSALVSLTMSAPASSAARATAALVVSTEMKADVFFRRAQMTGTTRPSSSASGTGCEPGRVLSPPTSMMSAPSKASSRPRSTAFWASKYSPPSEKESGVTLTTPMSQTCGTEGEALPPDLQGARFSSHGPRPFRLSSARVPLRGLAGGRGRGAGAGAGAGRFLGARASCP